MANGADLQVFDFNEHAVRIIMQDGEPWWVAKDICEILELTNPTEALKSLDDDEKMTLRNSEGHYNEKMTVGNSDGHSGERGGAQFYNIISESGLYTLIIRSNKPEAKKFRRWVTHEVLPSIRKTGSYNTARKYKVSDIKAMQRMIEKSEYKLSDAERRTMTKKLAAILMGDDVFNEINNDVAVRGARANDLIKFLRKVGTADMQDIIDAIGGTNRSILKIAQRLSKRGLVKHLGNGRIKLIKS